MSPRAPMLLRVALLAACSVSTAMAQEEGDVQLQDTFFHRLYKAGIVDAADTPGKYTNTTSLGQEATFMGLLGDAALPFNENISQAAGMLLYKYYDSAVADDIGGLNLAYGWGFYGLRDRTNVFVGLNARYGTLYPAEPAPGIELEEGLRVAPYVYTKVIAPSVRSEESRETFRFERLSFDAKLSEDYRDFSKLLLDVAASGREGEAGLFFERNGSAGTDSYDLATYAHIPLGAPDWGAGSDDMIALFGMPQFRARAGNSFGVDDVAVFGDQAFAARNWYANAEVWWAWVFGLSYRVGNGLGFRIGVDYELTEERLQVFDPEGTNQFPDWMRGKTIYAQAYYSRNYINTSLMGLYTDPSMLVLGVSIR